MIFFNDIIVEIELHMTEKKSKQKQVNSVKKTFK